MPYDLTLVPAYGRDYPTEEFAKKAWEDGRDFKIQCVMSPYNGKYTSIRDLSDFPGDHVKIRYNKLEDFFLYKIEQPKGDLNMEIIKFDKMSKNAQWAICTIDNLTNDPALAEDFIKNGFHIQLVINGKEYQFSEIIENLIRDHDRQLECEAADLLKEKASQLMVSIGEFEEMVNNKIREIFPNLPQED